MLKKLLEGTSLTYLTAISDMKRFVGECEKLGMTPKGIIKQLNTAGRSADLAINKMLRDMEKRDLIRKAAHEVHGMSPLTFPRPR